MNATDPKTVYITLNLRATQKSEKVKVKALHDSGCAKTIISRQIYNELNNTHPMRMKSLKNVSISSCTGEKTHPIGYISAFMEFKDEHNQTMSFPHNILVHETLDHDMLLGRDFTGSQHKTLETNDHMHLTLYPKCNKPSKEIRVPLENKTQVLFRDLIIESEITLSPFTMEAIPCKSNQALKDNSEQYTFEISHINLEDIEHVSAIYEIDKEGYTMIPLYNPTLDEIILEAGTRIAQITLIPHTTKIFYMSISNIEQLKSEQNNIKCMTMNLQDDTGMTEEEKEKAFLEYLESGQYTPSMTGYIENKPSVTEMSYKSTKGWTDNEFDDQFDLDHLSAVDKEHTLQILWKYRDVFSRHEMDIGLASNVEMEIEVDNNKPRIQKYYPLPHAVREQTKQILDQMIEYGMLRECNEPSNFLANLLVTKKKDGSVRVLLDGRLLNQATVRKATIMTAPLEIFTALAQKEYITLVDVSNAFWHIPIKYEHQPYTAFYSEAHGKRFCYTRAPQGLKNSPVYLHFLMCEMFAPLVKNVIHYADDLMLATEGNIYHHLKLLDKVLRRFQQYNIKLKPAKLEIMKPEVEFLGIVWRKGTLNIPEARIQGFKNLAPPTTPKKTKSFVCAVAYYRKFIDHFAGRVKALLDLAKLNPKQFKWLPTHQEAFKQLIQAVQDHTTLNLPNPNEPFYIQTDASDVAGAGRIYQLDENGDEKLIACVSRTFTRTERNYGVFRKEVLALLYTLKSLDFFLRFAPKVIIKVDAKSILFLRLCKDSAGILLRFSLELSKYDAEIHHVPGIENEISDMLSRQHKDIQGIMHDQKQTTTMSETEAERLLKRLLLPEGYRFTPEEVSTLLELESLPSPNPKKKKAESKTKSGKRNVKLTPQTLGERKIKTPPTTLRRRGAILPNQIQTHCLEVDDNLSCNHSPISYKDFSNMSKMIIPGQISIKDFTKLQEEDPIFGPIYKEPESQKGYTKINNVLFKETPTSLKPVLPTTILEPYVYTKHYTAMGLHQSKARIKRDIDSIYYTHGDSLKQQLALTCDKCVQCQFNNTKQDPHRLESTNFVTAPRASWAVDIIPSMTVTKAGNNALFLAVDMFTGYIQLKALKTRKTDELIQAVKDTIIIPFGAPIVIRSDNETGIQNSALFKQFLDDHNIQLAPCSTASPWSNGAAERAVQTIKKGIRTYIQMENEQDNWDEHVHIYTQSHNKSTNVHGHTPEELHFGFTNPHNNDIIQIWPNTDNTEEYITQITNIAAEKRNKAKQQAKRERDRSTTYRNRSRRMKQFAKGQIVLHRQLQVSTGTGGSLQPTFTGPYVVEFIEPHNNSAIIEHLHTGRQIHAHFTNMQLFELDPRVTRTPSRLDNLIDPIQTVERYSQDKYYPGHEEVRESLNLIHERKLEQVNRAYNQQNQELHQENHPESEQTSSNKDQGKENTHPMTTRSRSKHI